MTKSKPNNAPIAYEPDRSLRDLIGQDVSLTDIFTKEKIANCQKMVDEAKGSFFENSKQDVLAVIALSKKKELQKNFPEFCSRLFQPICNIKGQAELFGFSLIAQVCRYLLEYCENSNSSTMTSKDVLIVDKLVEALARAYDDKIIDAGGALESELKSIVELARKHSS